ncbi:MAG: T9SS type A sorting domain-containing protein [Saprospiraceae bacterium]
MNNNVLFLLIFLFPHFIQAQTGAGTLDQTFNNNGIVIQNINFANSQFDHIKVLDDGKILALGTTISTSGTPGAILIRYNPDGSIDPTFALNGVYDSRNSSLSYAVRPTDFLVLNDGKILIIMDVAWSNNIAFFRLLPNGKHDPSYGAYGKLIVPIPLYSPYPERFRLLNDGKLVLAGTYTDLSLGGIGAGFFSRILPDGTLDSLFGVNGIVKIQTPLNNQNFTLNDMIIQEDGKMVFTGNLAISSNYDEWYIGRLLEDGTYDNSFGGDGLINMDLGNNFESPLKVKQLQSGNLLIAGYASKLPGYHFTMLQFFPDGTLNSFFGLGGKSQVSFNCCYSAIYDVAEQPDGKLIACGYSSDDNDKLFFSIARFRPNGIIDQTFGDAGKVPLEIEKDSSQIAHSVALQQDGKILVAGALLDGLTATSAVLVRLNASGASATSNIPRLDEPTISVSPNPFLGNTITISYGLYEDGKISIHIYDLFGRKLSTPIVNAWRSGGEQKDEFEFPQNLPTGQYLIRVESEHGAQTIKVIKS